MHQLTIQSLARGYRDGTLRPTDVAEDCLQRASYADDSVFLELTADRARYEAGLSDARFRAGKPLSLLDGIPVSWKDLFDLKGLPTNAGSRALEREPAAQDACVVQALSHAGAVCVGKTNMSEFAFSGLGTNWNFGTPLNPNSPPGSHHVCGGSSSGAAASVALGYCALGMGTDTSGSIRVPAAFTGLCGWRPSQAAWPVDGMMALAPSLDTPGAVAWDAIDLNIVDSVITERAFSSNVYPLRVVVVKNLFEESGTAQKENLRRWLDCVQRTGYLVEYTLVPELQEVRELFRRHGTLVAAEAYHTYRAVLASPLVEQIDPFVRSRLERSKDFRVSDYLALQEARVRLRHTLRSKWTNALFVFPTTPSTAPQMSDLIDLDEYRLANEQALKHTMPGSFLDMPGLAMPTGFDEFGMPTSVLVSAPSASDVQVLTFCHSVAPRCMVPG